MSGPIDRRTSGTSLEFRDGFPDFRVSGDTPIVTVSEAEFRALFALAEFTLADAIYDARRKARGGEDQFILLRIAAPSEHG